MRAADLERVVMALVTMVEEHGVPNRFTVAEVASAADVGPLQVGMMGSRWCSVLWRDLNARLTEHSAGAALDADSYQDRVSLRYMSSKSVKDAARISGLVRGATMPAYFAVEQVPK